MCSALTNFVFNSQVKSFMRSDKDLVDHNSCSPAITILVSHLEFHLKRKGLKYNTVLLKNLQQIYEGSCKSGVAHTFLSLSTTLTDITRGRSPRKSADTVYQRSMQITKAAFSTHTLSQLEEGEPLVQWLLGSLSCYTGKQV